MLNASRTPEIMADAAYAILCRDPSKFTANFCIDEEVLSTHKLSSPRFFVSFASKFKLFIPFVSEKFVLIFKIST